MSRKLTTSLAIAALAVGSAITYSQAQDDTRPNRQNRQQGDRAQRGQGGQRGGWDPEQMRQRMSEMMKERLGVTDEEWEVLGPKLEAVTEAQQDMRGGGMMGMMGGRGMRGGMGGPGGQRGGEQAEQSELQQAQQALNQTLQNEEASADEIQDNLTAYREAREAAEEKLEEARGELKELVTARQEAMLVMMGMLE